MNTLFAKDVYIRLAEDSNSLVCTTKYGRLYAKATEFVLNHQPMPDAVDEKALVPSKSDPHIGP